MRTTNAGSSVKRYGFAAILAFHNRTTSLMRLYPTILLISVFVLSGCTQPEDTPPQAEEVPESLYFEVVGIGQAGNLSDTTEVVFRTPDEWAPIRDSLTSVEPFRSVDFSQTMIFLAALPQVSGGYRVQFESVEKSGDDILASYVVFAPDTDCLTLMALTLPYQVIAVRRAEGTVTFRRRVEMESCQLD